MGLFIRVHSFCDSTLGFLMQHFVHFMDCENSRVSECPLDLLELTHYWKLIL